MEWHQYDLDLSRAFRQIRTQIERDKFIFEKNTSLSAQDYLKNMQMTIEFYCRDHGFELKNYIEGRNPLIPSYNSLAYDFFLGYCLIAFDIPKIPFFLDFQEKKYVEYNGKENFVNMIEFLVYDYIRENSGFDLELRLNKIAYWIEKRRDSQLKHCLFNPVQGGSKDLKSKKDSTKVKELITYSKILDWLYESGQKMQRTPSLYKNKNEEGLRDALKHGAEARLVDNRITGETHQNGRKSDLYLKHSNGTATEFVGECKVWSGEGKIKGDIDQTLDYLGIQDDKGGLIYFIKNKNFIETFAKLQKEFLDYPGVYKRSVKKIKKYSYSYNFTLPNDKNKKVKVRLMAFHIPSQRPLKGVKSKPRSKKVK